jgi:uncharacterized membrane protein YfcA
LEPVSFFIMVFGAGILAGALGALLGIGGGLIIIPTLTLVAGVDIRYAMGASLVSVIATSSGAAATYVRDRMVNLRLAMFLEIATTTGAVVGAFLAGLLPVSLLSLMLGLMLVHAAWSTFRSRGDEPPPSQTGSPLAARLRLQGAYFDQALGRTVEYQVRRIPQGFAVMWGAGLLSGLLGIGSGLFKVIAMDRLMRAPLKASTTTSNFMIGVTAAASAGTYFARGDINPFIAAPVALGVLSGTVVGTRLLLRLRSGAIHKILVVILVIVAAQMIWRGVEGLLGGGAR